MDVPRSTGPHPDPIQGAIDQAVAAERERCAKIASDQQYGEPDGPQEAAYNEACNRIHDAILNQST